jgi:hypothetical protein
MSLTEELLPPVVAISGWSSRLPTFSGAAIAENILTRRLGQSDFASAPLVCQAAGARIYGAMRVPWRGAFKL